MEQNKQKRNIEYLDVAKGIGIFLVVLGHSLTKSIVDTSTLWRTLRIFIYEVHMPLFFLISGFLFAIYAEKYKKFSFSQFIRKKAIVYIVPYLSFSIIFYCIFNILRSIPDLTISNSSFINGNMSLNSFFISMIIFENPIDEHLWFAYVIFWILIIAFIFNMISFNNLKRNIFITLICMLLYIMTYIFIMPYLLKKVIRYLLYFRIGGYSGLIIKFIEKNRKYKKILWIIWLVLFIIYKKLFYNNSILLPLQGFIILLIGLCGSYSLILFSKFLCNTKFFFYYFTRIGKKSYPIYLYHQPFIINGLVFIFIKLNIPNTFVVFISTIMGIEISLLIYKWLVSKYYISKLLFAGGH